MIASGSIALISPFKIVPRTNLEPYELQNVYKKSKRHKKYIKYSKTFKILREGFNRS